MDLLNVNFHQIVKDLLEHNTQTELAEKTGVHQGVISDLNNNKPKPHLTYKYGMALVLAHQELKKGEQIKPEPEEA